MQSWNQRVQDTQTRVAIHERIGFDTQEAVKVSVVVPIYGTENYLPQCLDSILAQDFDSFEVVCVSDGSPGDAAEILRAYAERDSRVRAIVKDNAGYGHTMNLGMDAAKGDFILIVESDDYILPGMLQTLWSAAEDNELDFIKSDFYRFTTESLATRLFYHALTTDRTLYNRVMRASDNELLFRFTNTWTGLYRTSFLKKWEIRHQETPGASYQDNGFWFQTTTAADRIMYLETPFYMNRRDNPNSSVFNDKKLYAGNSEFAFSGEFLQQHPELHEEHSGVLVKKKWDTYKYNYRRVSSELKLEYAKTCATEFAQEFANSNVDPELFSNGDWEQLTLMTTAPERFHERNKNLKLAAFAGLSAPGTVAVAMITDENYSVPAAVAIQSLKENRSQNTKYQVTIVGIGLSHSTIKRLSELKESNVEIQILALEASAVEALGGETLTNYGVPPTALVKFLLPSLMASYDKVLYIDDDVLVKRDLAELFATELGTNYAGVVADMPQVLYEKQTFGSQFGRNYFNSGVLLLNIAKMREDGTQQLLVETKKTSDSPLQDQDIFNEVFASKVVHLPIRYNTLMINLVRSKHKFDVRQINTRFGTRYGSLEDIRRDSAILHYCSKDKPWKYFDVPMADAWISTLSRTPFADVHMRRHSLLNADDETELNGIFERVGAEERQRRAVAVLATQADYSKVRVLAEAILGKTTDASMDIFVLHRDLPEEYKIKLTDLSEGGLHVILVNIKKLMDLEMAKYGKKQPPSSYWKLLVPELIPHREMVMVLDDVVLDGNLDDEFRSFAEDQANVRMTPTQTGSLRLLDAAAALIRPSAFLECEVKEIFFRHFVGIGSKFFGSTRSASIAIKALRPESLTPKSIDAAAHNARIAFADLQSDLAKSGKKVELPQAFAAARTSDNADRMPASLDLAQKRIQTLESSTSFRLGRLITYVPGKAKRVLKRLKR